MGMMGTTRRQYSREFKQEAVKRVTEQGVPLAKVARDLDLNQNVLRRWKHKHPQSYLAQAGTAAAIGGDEVVPVERLPFEYMLNLLRLHEGFAEADFAVATGLPASTLAAPLAVARERGWLEETANHWRPTELGRRFTNDVIELFLD